MNVAPASRSQSLGGLNLNFTKLSRVIAGVLVAGYLAQLIAPSSRQYLALVPGRFIPCVWNIFTAGILEVIIWRLLFSVMSILLLARIIEPVWGSREFVKFICFVNVMSGAGTLMLLYVVYAMHPYAEKAAKVLYGEFCGFHGVVAACLVALKQIAPDNEVKLLAIIKFRAKHLPGIYVLSVVLGSIILGGSLNNIPTALLSTYLAWVYLRFLQTKPELALRGDPSSEFRFATFFPEPTHPLVDQLVSKFIQVLPLSTDALLQTSQPNAAATPLTTPEQSDATRRRERGARALEERLNMKKAAAAGRATVATDVEAGHQAPASDS